jgi:hypothetical protein
MWILPSAYPAVLWSPLLRYMDPADTHGGGSPSSSHVTPHSYHKAG